MSKHLLTAVKKGQKGGWRGKGIKDKGGGIRDKEGGKRDKG